MALNGLGEWAAARPLLGVKQSWLSWCLYEYTA